jgi:hypothetical protein
MRPFDQMGAEQNDYARPKSRFLMDEVGVSIAGTNWGFHESLHVPIAATDEGTIAKYVGDIEASYGSKKRLSGVLVRVKEPPSPQMDIPVWHSPRSNRINPPLQLWVRSGVANSRELFTEAFPDRNIDDLVVLRILGKAEIGRSEWAFHRTSAVSRRTAAFSQLCRQRLASTYNIQYRGVLLTERSLALRYAHPIDIALLMDIPVSIPIFDLSSAHRSDWVAANVSRA